MPNQSFTIPSIEGFTWTFKEFDHHARGVWWYVIAGVAVALTVLYSFATNNFLFTVIVVLAVLIIFARQFQTPAEVTCEITPSGIRIGKKQYSFKDITSFSIIERGDGARVLYVHEARGLQNILPLPLIDIEPESIKLFLMEFLEEDTDHQYEPVWDWLMRALRI